MRLTTNNIRTYKYSKIIGRLSLGKCGSYQYKSPYYGYKTAYKYQGTLYIYKNDEYFPGNGYLFYLPVRRHIPKSYIKQVIEAINISNQPNIRKLAYQAQELLS